MQVRGGLGGAAERRSALGRAAGGGRPEARRGRRRPARLAAHGHDACRPASPPPRRAFGGRSRGLRRERRRERRGVVDGRLASSTHRQGAAHSRWLRAHGAERASRSKIGVAGRTAAARLVPDGRAGHNAQSRLTEQRWIEKFSAWVGSTCPSLTWRLLISELLRLCPLQNSYRGKIS